MLALIVLVVLGLSVPVIAQGQVNCIQLGAALSCDTPRGNTTITEFSRGQGIITQQLRNGSSTLDTYSIIGQDNSRSSSYNSTRLPELERLPSYGSSQRSSSFEERERARDERYGR